MSLYFREPFFSLNDLQRFVDDAFDRTGFDRPTTSERQLTRRDENDTQRSLARGFQPRMDIHESPENNLVTATFELPGLTKENVQIEARPGRLIVSGEQTISNELDEDGYVHRERRYGRFERSVPVPTWVGPGDIKASMDNGVLKITYPKASQEQETKKITIS